MTKLDELADLISANEIDQALGLFRKSQEDIVQEHRRRAADKEGGYYVSIYNDLVGARLDNGDESADSIIEELIAQSVLLNEVDWSGFTPLALLAHGGHFQLVKHAVENGANVNLGDYPALTAAVFPRILPNSWQEIVTYLTDHGSDPNGPDGTLPSLFCAIRSNHQDAIRLLASRGAEVNKIYDLKHWGDFSGTTLHWAVRGAYSDHTDIETLSLLVELGADPVIKNKSGDCPVDFAYYKDIQDDDSVRPLIEFLSRKKEWRKASWRLSRGPVSHYNPTRQTKIDDPSIWERIWEGVEFRRGDRIKIIRRGGWMNPSLPELPDSRAHACDVVALPELTGTIRSFHPYGSDHQDQFKLVVEFDPGTWEEAKNYGKTARLPRCVDSVHPEIVRIATAAEFVGKEETGMPSAVVPTVPSHRRREPWENAEADFHKAIERRPHRISNGSYSRVATAIETAKKLK